MNIIMNDAHSYATRETALAKMRAALTELDLLHVRCFILVNHENRFVPAVLQSSIDPAMILPLVHKKISVVG
jgi:hypothetical protein